MELESIEFDNGMVGKIWHDDYAADPRKEWDNLATMICFHGRYNLGDHPQIVDWGQYSSFDEVEKAILRRVGPCVILPMYMLDHSGIMVSTTDFNDKWDSGQIGFVYVSYARLREEMRWKNITKDRIKRAYEWLEAEVQIYGDYLEGNVFGYTLENREGDEVDSCWGYYGYKHCLEELESIAKSYKE